MMLTYLPVIANSRPPLIPSHIAPMTGKWLLQSELKWNNFQFVGDLGKQGPSRTLGSCFWLLAMIPFDRNRIQGW
jgi:hypothetical protein